MQTHYVTNGILHVHTLNINYKVKKASQFLTVWFNMQSAVLECAAYVLLVFHTYVMKVLHPD